MPFVLIQVLMVGLIIAFPGLVSSGLVKDEKIDLDKAFQQMQNQPRESYKDAPVTLPSGTPASGASAAPEAASEKDDPMKGLLESMSKDQKKP